MSTQDYGNEGQTSSSAGPTKTIDLQGVASFASLVELLAQELGTTPGKLHGNLPNGPSTFNELIGEIDKNNQGYIRRLTLLARPGVPLVLRFQAAVGSKSDGEAPNQFAGGVTSDFFLSATVEQIIPQGRALARYIEDVFSVLDRMVTLGQSNKLATMQFSAAEMQRFESAEGVNLVRQSAPKNPSANSI